MQGWWVGFAKMIREELVSVLGHGGGKKGRRENHQNLFELEVTKNSKRRGGGGDEYWLVKVTSPGMQ